MSLYTVTCTLYIVLRRLSIELGTLYNVYIYTTRNIYRKLFIIQRTLCSRTLYSVRVQEYLLVEFRFELSYPLPFLGKKRSPFIVDPLQSTPFTVNLTITLGLLDHRLPQTLHKTPETRFYYITAVYLATVCMCGGGIVVAGYSCSSIQRQTREDKRVVGKKGACNNLPAGLGATQDIRRESVGESDDKER